MVLFGYGIQIVWKVDEADPCVLVRFRLLRFSFTGCLVSKETPHYPGGDIMNAEQESVLSDQSTQEAFAAIASRVKQLRYGKGWGPDELAGRAKISRTALYQIENGRTEQPRAGTVRRLARALGVDPAELLQARATEPSALLRDPAQEEQELPPGRPSQAAPPISTSGPEASSQVGREDFEARGAESVPPWLKTLELERKFRRLLNSPLHDAVSRIVEESYRLLPPEPFERNS